MGQRLVHVHVEFQPVQKHRSVFVGHQVSDETFFGQLFWGKKKKKIIVFFSFYYGRNVCIHGKNGRVTIVTDVNAAKKYRRKCTILNTRFKTFFRFDSAVAIVREKRSWTRASVTRKKSERAV